MSILNRPILVDSLRVYPWIPIYSNKIYYATEIAVRCHINAKLSIFHISKSNTSSSLNQLLSTWVIFVQSLSHAKVFFSSRAIWSRIIRGFLKNFQVKEFKVFMLKPIYIHEKTELS